MTDLEISKALALAIGWSPHDLFRTGEGVVCYTLERHPAGHKVWDFRIFDYRDWNVICPIAAKYDCFPARIGLKGESWCAISNQEVIADTPQKAMALAVIGAAK